MFVPKGIGDFEFCSYIPRVTWQLIGLLTIFKMKVVVFSFGGVEGK